MDHRNARSFFPLVLVCLTPAVAFAQQSVALMDSTRPATQDWVLKNPHLRATLRSDNLTLSVEDLDAHETWGSDPWENSAGRIHLRSKSGETMTVALAAAGQK